MRPDILAQVIFINYHLFFHFSDFKENRRNRRSMTSDFEWHRTKERRTESKKVISNKLKFQDPGQIETNLTIGAPMPLC